MWSQLTRHLVELACEEDLAAAGDITSALLPGGAAPVTARVVPRQAGIICGLTLGREICTAFTRRLQQPLEFKLAAATAGRNWQDSDAVRPGDCVATLAGPRAAVLTAERTLLNFLGRLSGVATLTRRYVDAAHAANPHVQVLDTRKTLPGWRELDKYAVRCGGGHNHRSGLYDAVLIKDNHLAGIPHERLAATLTEWLSSPLKKGTGSAPDPRADSANDVPRGACTLFQRTVSRLTTRPSFIEVEVDGLEQLAEVMRVPAVNIVLLDNFTPAQMQAAVAQRDAAGLRGKLALEASGGVTLETIAAIAATGVDRISVGALTHSAAALDIGLDI